MKKIISILLSVILVLSVGTVSVGVQAKSQKIPTTYNPVTYSYSGASSYSAREYKFSKGTVSYSSNLIFENSKGKEFVIEKAVAENRSIWSMGAFYARIDKIYYAITYEYGDEERFVRQIKSSSLDGKKQKVLFASDTELDDKFELIGGYGENVIYRHKNQVYKWNNGKTTKLFKTSNDVEIFNGRLYDGKKVYTAGGKALKSFVYKSVVKTKKYLYYINKNGNLKRLDKQGNNKTVDSKGKIGKIYLANDGQTVIYSKGTGDKETFYRRTGLKKATVKLVSVKELFGMFENQPTGEPIEKTIDKIILHDNKVYFSLKLDEFVALVNVGVGGKNLTLNIEKKAFKISIFKQDGKIECLISQLLDADTANFQTEYYYF